MLESEFWAKCRKTIPKAMMARRIEDRSGNLGTFDTFLAMGGVSGWLELKVAGPNAKPNIRPGQPAFARECFDAGVPAAYLVGSDSGRVRLLHPLTREHDWREHLIMDWDYLDMREIWQAMQLTQKRGNGIGALHLHKSAG